MAIFTQDTLNLIGNSLREKKIGSTDPDEYKIIATPFRLYVCGESDGCAILVLFRNMKTFELKTFLLEDLIDIPKGTKDFSELTHLFESE